MDKIKQWALLTVVAIVAVAVGGWFVLISPQRSHASDLRSQKASQDQRNAQLRNELASLQAQHKGLPEVQAELAKLGIQLPNNPGLPALIRSLSSAADAAGVDLVSLSPSAPTAFAGAAPAAPSSSAPSATGASAAPAANVGALQNIPISVVVNGGYFQVEQFVSNLEAMTRPFLTTGISMAPGKPAAPSGSTAASSTTSSGTTATDAYDGHLLTTITGQVFMVSGGAPSAATGPTATK